MKKTFFKEYSPDLFSVTLKMAWPAVAEAFFVALTTVIDSYMVSSLGTNAVAAVGLTTQPKYIGLAIFQAFNVSVSALIARRRGEKLQDDANTILFTYLIVMLITSAVTSILAVIFADEILTLCGSKPETHELAKQYMNIILGCQIFNVFQMGINAAQRGAGYTRIAMRTNITSSIVNIIFNYLLIGGNFGFPALGIQGAAIATVLGTVVACVMSFISLFKKGNFIGIPYIVQNKILPSFRSFLHMLKVGYSVFIERLSLRVGFLATALMAANQGTNALAAHQVSMDMMNLSFAIGDGLQAAAVALIGRSLGEKNPELAKKYGIICSIYGWIASVVVALVFLLGKHAIYGAFFSEEEVIEIGVSIMYVMVAGVFFQIQQAIYTGCLRGAGDTLYTAMVGIICVVFIRTIVSYFGGYTFAWGIVGIWLGIFADQFSRYFFVMGRYKTGKWTTIKI